MRIMRGIVLMGAALLMTVSSAWADGRHHRSGANVGIYVGPGFFWGPPVYRPYYPRPYYYPGPYYETAPIIVRPVPPPVYIEQGNIQENLSTISTQEATNYWYYCRESKGYYPYVKDCKGEWQKVLPTPEK